MIVYQDTHCHLNLNQFNNDLEEVIQRAQQAGVDRILVPGIDLETSRQAIRISDKFESVFAAVGIHPNSANSWENNSINDLRVLCNHPKVVAIGEIGLDYYRSYSEPVLQKKILAAQMELAAETSKPLILHNRNALHDLIPMLKGWVNVLRDSETHLVHRPGVLHSFEGDLNSVNQLVEMGFYIGVSGPVTFTNAIERQNIVKEIPLHVLIAETDAPYLTPHPYRGQRNEPSWVSFVVQKIAVLKDLSLEQTTTILTDNGNHLFGWRKFD